MSWTCSLWACNDKTRPKQFKTCKEWQKACIEERLAVRNSWSDEEKYKNCVSECNETEYSLNYRGNNRRKVLTNCISRCKN